MVNLADGSFTQMDDIPGFIAVRDHGTGFHIAVEASTGVSLFNIDPNGTVTSLGAYPASAT
ncbi:MAG TPA: hypothetical protein VHW01_04620 [Polyangiaceae bacterium]|nr:hypothetical protein [Polyangiaceae bacterium]